jgi:hypothetical protein
MDHDNQLIKLKLLVMPMLLLGVFGRPSLPIQHLLYIIAIQNSTD